MEIKSRQRSKRNIPHHTSHAEAGGATLADPDDLKKAAQILNDGKNVAILAGRGALQATAELEQLAEILGAPIVKALLGRAAVPDDSAYTTGTIGLLGTKPSQEAMETCDTLLMVGTSFPYLEFLPKPDHAKGVQIEIDPKRIGLRFPVEVGLVGDCRRILRDLLPRLKRKENRSFLEKAQKGMDEWRRIMEECCQPAGCVAGRWFWRQSGGLRPGSGGRSRRCQCNLPRRKLLCRSTVLAWIDLEMPGNEEWKRISDGGSLNRRQRACRYPYPGA